MKVRVRIDGYVDVDDAATEEQVRETVMFQLGWGGMTVDNPACEIVGCIHDKPKE